MKKALIMATTVLCAALAASCTSSTKETKTTTNELGLSDTTETSSSTTESSTSSSSSTDNDALAKLQPADIILPSQLKGKVEVINGEDGYIPVYLDEYNYPQIDITLKLLKKVDTSTLKGAAYDQFWVIGVPQDKSGRAVKSIIPNYGEWRSNDSAGDEIDQFLSGEPESTITFTYTGTNNTELFEKDEAKIQAGKEKTIEGCKKIAKFQLKITTP